MYIAVRHATDSRPFQGHGLLPASARFRITPAVRSLAPSTWPCSGKSLHLSGIKSEIPGTNPDALFDFYVTGIQINPFPIKYTIV